MRGQMRSSGGISDGIDRDIPSLCRGGLGIDKIKQEVSICILMDILAVFIDIALSVAV